MDDTTRSLVLYAQHDSRTWYAIAQAMRDRGYMANATAAQESAARDAAIARRLLGIDE